jgi:hypothetical protein
VYICQLGQPDDRNEHLKTNFLAELNFPCDEHLRMDKSTGGTWPAWVACRGLRKNYPDKYNNRISGNLGDKMHLRINLVS